MRDKMRKKIFMVLWIVLVISGLSVMSAYREHQFNEQLDENIDQLEQRITDETVTVKEDWKSLNTSDSEQISHLFASELLSACYLYLLDMNHYFKDVNKGNLLGRTIILQGHEYSSLDVYMILTGAYNDGANLWNCHPLKNKELEEPEIFCEILMAYIQDNQEWEEFMQSESYPEFISDFFIALEKRNGTTLQEAYQYIIDQENTYVHVGFYSEILLGSYQYLIKKSHENYLLHKEQNDFIHAQMDAEIIYYLFDTYQIRGNLQLKDILFYPPLSRGPLLIHNGFYDLIIILFITSVFTVIIFILTKKTRKKDNN
jgi:hypothetical protein